MLAERRERKKWSVDPNGTNWSRDSNKYGSKMLEKMGWTQGKGLGANEDGCTENIRVKKKNDLRGVGCSMSEVHNWVAHQDDFSSILAQLNDHHTDQGGTEEKTVNGVTNLEKHSKSQKRVHYHKFTRGKDLSNYKDDDLAAIFGKRATKSAPVTPLNLSEDESSGADSSSSAPEKKPKKRRLHEEPAADTPSNHVTSSMSVQEYFAKRMALLKNKASPSELESSTTGSEEGGREEPKVESEMLPTTERAETEELRTKKTKKKKGRARTETSDRTQGDLISVALKTEGGKELPEKKAKLKRKNVQEDQSTDDLSLNGVPTKKKKSKKRKMNKKLEDVSSPNKLKERRLE